MSTEDQRRITHPGIEIPTIIAGRTTTLPGIKTGATMPREGEEGESTPDRASGVSEAAPGGSGIQREPGSDRPPPDTAPERPEDSSSEPPPMPRDLWRDRLRVLGDRTIYVAVLFVMYRLRMADKLDPGVTIALLLVAGIRLENGAAFLAKKAGSSGGAVGAVLTMFHVRGVGIPRDAWQSFFRG